MQYFLCNIFYINMQYFLNKYVIFLCNIFHINIHRIFHTIPASIKPDWKKYTDQAYSWPRDAGSATSWGGSCRHPNPPSNITAVYGTEGFKGGLNMAPIMLRGVYIFLQRGILNIHTCIYILNGFFSLPKLRSRNDAFRRGIAILGNWHASPGVFWGG